jgi:hypothetical protein
VRQWLGGHDEGFVFKGLTIFVAVGSWCDVISRGVRIGVDSGCVGCLSIDGGKFGSRYIAVRKVVGRW